MPCFQEVRDFLNEWEPIHKQNFPGNLYIFPDYFHINRNTIEKRLELDLKNFELTGTIKGGERRIKELWKKPFTSFWATRVTELIEEIGIFEACCFLGHKPLTALEKYKPPSRKAILRALNYRTIDPTAETGHVEDSSTTSPLLNEHEKQK